MQMFKKTRNRIRVICFAVAATLAIGGAFLQMANRSNRLEREIIHRYQASLEELTSSMDNMALTLTKSTYTGTPASFHHFTDQLVLQAGTAGAALASLPLQETGATSLSKFISQVSDYTLSLSRQMTNGKTLSDRERKQLIQLADIAADVSRRLEDTRLQYNDAKHWQQNLEQTLAGIPIDSGWATAVTETEEALQEAPTLLYDGPFSDHIQNQESLFLADKKEVSLSKARKKAADTLGVTVDQVTDAGTEESNLPAYLFTADNHSIAITKIGGYVIYFRKESTISDTQMSYEQAADRAEDFVNSLSLGSFQKTYFFADEGVCVVNFAARQNDVICYTDLIKVGVALDSGEVVFYEARGFLMNHHRREIPSKLHSATEAKAKLNPHMEVQNVSLAIIPSGGQQERLCYEFHVLGEKKEELLVYIHAETLTEENILLLLKTDGGTLTK